MAEGQKRTTVTLCITTFLLNFLKNYIFGVSVVALASFRRHRNVEVFWLGLLIKSRYVARVPVAC